MRNLPPRFGGRLRLLAMAAAFALPAGADVIDPIFGDGFEARACAWTEAAPPEGCGPGHLVLIGHDFAPAAMARGASSDATAVTGIEQVLVDAVAQSPATGLGRATRLLILDENAESGELGHVSSVLSGAFALTTESVLLSGVASALEHSDVLLIPDQNGFFAGAPAQAAAAQLAPSLRAFLEAGGVVVVLDGTYVQGQATVPSQTHRALAPELLAVDDAAAFVGCAEVPCNEADPLLGGIAGTVCPPGNVVGFGTDEPWVTLARREEGAPDRPFVLHKWFGKADTGPIAFDLDDADPGADLRGKSVFFQNAAGQSVAQCLTLSNGTAVHQMGADSFVSLGVNSGSRQLTTVIGAQPLDHLEQRAQPSVPSGDPFQVTANLPGAVQDASAYRVMLGCDGSPPTGNLSIVVGTTTACANTDGSFNVVAEALSASGQILAYTIKNGVTAATPQPIVMPAWRAPDFLPFTSGGTPAGLQSVALDVKLSTTGGVDYLEGGGPVLKSGNGSVFSFYADPGLGQPAFAQLTHHARLRFFSGGLPYVVLSDRTGRGPLLDSLAIAYTDFLPRLTDAALGFDGSQRMTLAWSLAASATGVDGGIAQASWNRDFVFYQWAIVFPPGITSLTAPPNPGADGDMFWPSSSQDSVSLNTLRLDDSTFLPSYDAYRQDLLGIARPPAGPYVLRTTQFALP